MDEGYNKKLMMATQSFKDRASGKALPDGEMNSDRIFILSPTERRACCRDIVPGNQRFSLSSKKHACSKRHIAALFRIELIDFESELSTKSTELSTDSVDRFNLELSGSNLQPQQRITSLTK